MDGVSFPEKAFHGETNLFGDYSAWGTNDHANEEKFHKMLFPVISTLKI